MKAKFSALLTAALLTASYSDAAVRLEMEENGQKTVVIADGKGLAKLANHPFKSEFYYDTSNGNFYVELDEGFTYFIGTYGLETVPTGALQAKTAEQGKTYAKFKGKPWNLRADNEECGTVYTNKTLSQVTKMDMSDIAAINLALSHIYALDEKKSSKCQAYKIPSMLGNWVGFPIGFISKEGVESKLISHNSVHLEKPFHITKFATPLNTVAHINILKRELTAESKTHFSHIEKRLKGQPEIQLKTIKKILKRQLTQDK